MPPQPSTPNRDAVRQVRTVRPHRPRGPHLAEPGDPQGPDVVLGRPARRQPGAHRPDGPDPQTADVHRARRDGLQGDRGRLPVGQPARLRLPAPADRGGPDPRRRVDPGPRPVSRRADRAHVRGARRRPAGDRALLQLDQPAAARGRVQPRPGRHQGGRGRRCSDVQGSRGAPAEATRRIRHRDPLRVQPGELHAHRAGLRDRGVRGGDGRDRAERRRPASSSTCRRPSSATPPTCTAT